jgi:multiple sugar transport system ATP-binding protein
VMNEGRLQQVGTPREVYARPANLFVAGFIGSPSMNLLAGHVVDGELRVAEARIADAGVACGCAEPVVGLRPEAFRLNRTGTGAPVVPFVVDVVEPMGHEAIVHGRLRNGSEAPVVVRLDAHDEPRPGDVLDLTFAGEDLHVFDPESGQRLVP